MFPICGHQLQYVVHHFRMIMVGQPPSSSRHVVIGFLLMHHVLGLKDLGVGASKKTVGPATNIVT